MNKGPFRGYTERPLSVKKINGNQGTLDQSTQQ